MFISQRMLKIVLKVLSGGLLILALSGYAAEKHVSLVTSVWEPYVMPKNISSRGYAYDVVKKAFESAGYEVSIQVLPWNEAWKMAKEGKADALFPEYESDENLGYFAYSHPFLAGPVVLYKRVDNKYIQIAETEKNLSSVFDKLKPYRFGVVSGYANVPAFDVHKEEFKRKYVGDDKANLEQLYAGEVDVILIDKLNAQYILRYMLPKEYSQQLQQVGPVLANNNIYVVFSKAVPNRDILLKDFNQGLKMLQKDKVTNQIMREYIYEFIDKDAAPHQIDTH